MHYEEEIETLLDAEETEILGYAFSNPVIGQICHIISAGVFIASILVLFVLPGIICALDDRCGCK